MPILTAKHCRETPAPGDGARILTMRHWPRGVRKEHFDAWYRHLAPSPELLSTFLELRRAAGKGQDPGPGDPSWDGLMARYIRLAAPFREMDVVGCSLE